MDQQIYKLTDLCTKTYVYTTRHLVAINDSVRILFKVASEVNNAVLKKTVFHDCRKIKRKTNEICAKAKTLQKEYEYEVYKIRGNEEYALNILINAKSDFLQLKKNLNDILFNIESCIEEISNYQKPYKTAKLMLYTYDDEFKKRQCKQYLESELQNQEVLKKIRRICLLEKKRLIDIDKQYNKMIIRINTLLDGRN